MSRAQARRPVSRGAKRGRRSVAMALSISVCRPGPLRAAAASPRLRNAGSPSVRATTANISALALRLSTPVSNAPSSAAFMTWPAQAGQRRHHHAESGPAARVAVDPAARSAGLPAPRTSSSTAWRARAASARSAGHAFELPSRGGHASRVLTRLKKQPERDRKAISPTCAGV